MLCLMVSKVSIGPEAILYGGVLETVSGRKEVLVQRGEPDLEPLFQVSAISRETHEAWTNGLYFSKEEDATDAMERLADAGINEDFLRESDWWFRNNREKVLPWS